MLRIAAVDAGGESRKKLVEQITSYSNSDLRDISLIPRLSVKPLTIEELKFNSAPDICIVGSEISSANSGAVADIRKTLPDTPILVKIRPEMENLAAVERLACLGADAVFSEDTSPHEFFKSIIMLSKKSRKPGSGKLVVVDSGKGGVGVTSAAAALGEALLADGGRVVLIDFDFESQDLSRFLQARPFINENLQLLFEGSRPVSEELIEQCLIPVWGEEEGLYCMTPPPDSEAVHDPHSGYSRALVSILEVLDETFDAVVIDTGSCTGSFLKTIYRVADKMLFLVNDDPATLYASAARLLRIKSQMAPEAGLAVLENSTAKNGLSSAVLRREFSLAGKLEPSDWIKEPIPYSKKAARWPGSGDTMASCGDKNAAKCFLNISRALGLTDINSAGENKGVFAGRLSLSRIRKQIGYSGRKEVEKALQINFASQDKGDKGSSAIDSDHKADLIRLPEKTPVVRFDRKPGQKPGQTVEKSGEDKDSAGSKKIRSDMDAGDLFEKAVIQ